MLRGIGHSALAAALLAVSLVALPSAGKTQDAASLRFGAEGFALANGMQVVVIPNHRVPAVTQMVWYKAGGADEPRGKSGIAHFLEHLMFKGTKDVAPGMFSTQVLVLIKNSLKSNGILAMVSIAKIDYLDIGLRDHSLLTLNSSPRR